MTFRSALFFLNVTGRQSLLSKLLEHRINLPIALGPEVAGTHLNILLEIITRHWSKTEHAQHGISALVFFTHNFVLPYICHTILSSKILYDRYISYKRKDVNTLRFSLAFACS